MILGRRSARPSSAPRAPARGPVIPYEYAARFDLTGHPGNVVQDVITVSPDGAFVAAAIGYGFLEDRSAPVPLGLTGNRVPAEVTLGELPISALLSGLRSNPRAESMLFEGSAAEDDGGGLAYSSEEVSPELLDKLFLTRQGRRDLSFLFSMVDSSTGRELQDEPLHSLASLGAANGERPFRLLARPLRFLPRSTLRLQVVERTQDARGTLFIVLLGFTAVVPSSCPEPEAEAIVAAATRAAAAPGGEDRVVPFDYVAHFRLTGRARHVIEQEITVNAEGGFVATDVGYGLSPELEPVVITPPEPPAKAEETAAASTVAAPVAGPGTAPPTAPPAAPTEEAEQKKEDIDLAALPLAALPPMLLRTGFRLRPEYARIALGDRGVLQPLPRPLAEACFEQLNAAEDVTFLYAISDTGAGRDWQNRPILNVAGLGTASGRRPFKRLARPRLLPPRSTLRITVEECSGRGMLYIALHGYKLLRTGAGGRA